MQFSTDERVFMLREYLNSWLYERVCTVFSNEYPNLPLPLKSTILWLVQKFLTTGSVLNKLKVRVCTVRTSANAQHVRDSVANNSCLSTRRHSHALNISRTSMQHILRQLKMHQYQFLIVEELKPPDHSRRVTFCHWILHLMHLGHDIGVLDNFFYSDEAWFHLDSSINAQNYRIWSQENPHEYRESGLHPQKIGLWCAMSHLRIIGPIFFETTVNGEVYQDIITQFIALLEEDERDCVFQQDGACTHTVCETIEFLHEFFGKRFAILPL